MKKNKESYIYENHLVCVLLTRKGSLHRQKERYNKITLLSIYSTPHYNMDLDITQPC